MAMYRCGGGSSGSDEQKWINPSPTSSFAAQTISGLVVSAKDTITVCTIPSTGFATNESYRYPRNFVAALGSSYTLESNGTSKVRTMSVNSDGTITIGNAATGTGDNGFCIPVYIIVTPYIPVS